MAAFDDLQQLIDLIGESERVTELSVTGPAGEKITIRKRVRPLEPFAPTAPGLPTAYEQPSAPGAASEPAPVAEPEPETVEANRVGVFHPARPAVQIGDTVSDGQIVGYIESMKLMNEVLVGNGGRVAEQLVDDGAPVEYGQPLFVIV